MLQELNRKVDAMSTQLAALQAQVAANTAAVNQAIALIQSIPAQIAAATAATDDTTALEALTTQMQTDDANLTAAVAAASPPAAATGATGAS
jgi:hypothetical protein